MCIVFTKHTLKPSFTVNALYFSLNFFFSFQLFIHSEIRFSIRTLYAFIPFGITDYTKNRFEIATVRMNGERERENAFAHRMIVCYIEHTVVYFHLLCTHEKSMNSTKRLIVSKIEKQQQEPLSSRKSNKKEKRRIEKKINKKRSECVQWMKQ